MTSEWVGSITIMNLHQYDTHSNRCNGGAYNLLVTNGCLIRPLNRRETMLITLVLAYIWMAPYIRPIWMAHIFECLITREEWNHLKGLKGDIYIYIYIYLGKFTWAKDIAQWKSSYLAFTRPWTHPPAPKERSVRTFLWGRPTAFVVFTPWELISKRINL